MSYPQETKFDGPSAGQFGYPQSGTGQPMPPPQYGYPPQGPQQPINVGVAPGQTTIIVQSPTAFRDVPITTVCPNCQQTVTTMLVFHATCVGYLLVGLWAFCCECVQNVEHKCPNCANSIGMYERFPC